MFVLDASGSVGSFNFNNRILPFVVDVVNELDIGTNQSQVGVIRFASSPSILFNLNTHNNKTDLINAINGIPYTGGGTDTAAALDLLRISGFAGARPVSQGIPRYAVVVTDGLSNSPPATIIAAMALHNVTPSITVYAAGISGANVDELNVIASEPQFNTTFVIFINTFSDTESLTNMIITETCRGIIIICRIYNYIYGMPYIGIMYEGLRYKVDQSTNIEFTPPNLRILSKLVTGAAEILRFSHFGHMHIGYACSNSISGYFQYLILCWSILPLSPSDNSWLCLQSTQSHTQSGS